MRRLAGLAAAFFSSALIAGAAPETGLLPADANWGSAPAEDWPQRAPKLLPYRGWCLYLGTQDYGPEVAIHSNLMLAKGRNGLRAFDVASGAQKWSLRLSDDDYDWSDLASPGDPIICSSRMLSGTLTAVDPLSGKLLWTRPQQQFLGRAGKLIWTGFPMTDDYRNVWATSHYELLDSATGEIRFQATPSGLLARALGDPGPDGPQALATIDGIELLYANGERGHIAIDNPDWNIALWQFPGGVLVEQAPPDPDALLARQTGRSEDEIMNDADRDASEARWNAWQPEPSRLRCYSVPEGKLLWNRDYEGPSEDSNWIYVAENHVSVRGDYVEWAPDYSSQYLRLSDGQTVFNTTAAGQRGNFALNGPYLYQLNTSTGAGTSTLLRHDLRDGRQQEFALAYSGWGGDLRVTDDWLLLQPAQGGWNDAFPENGSCYCIALGPDGMPSAGSMAGIGFPDTFPELQQRFFASAAPLQDSTLMLEIVGLGMNSVFRLTEAADLRDAVHLDALAAACVYIMKVQGSDRFNASVLNGFVSLLRERAGAELAASLQRWQADPSLELLHPQLPGLLAQCGTSEAGQWLADSTTPTGVRHRAASPPYHLMPRSSYPTGFGPGSAATLPSVLKAADGSSWAAFYCNGLLSGTVIYLAQDLQSDGLYDQVWPTALRQCYAEEPRGDYEQPQAMAGLTLLAADSGHFELSYMQVGWDSLAGPEEHGWQGDFVVPASASLSLAELKADSDADGLSDITEKLLETDPRRADSDGDGIPDAQDGAPLSNPAWMGPAERGVARALAFFFADSENGRGLDWWTASTGNPWQARYLTLYGAAPVDYVQRPDVYSIFENSAQQSHWRQGPKLDPAEFVTSGDEHVELTWMQGGQTIRERYSDYCSRMGLDPGAASPQEILSWSSRFGYFYADTELQAEEAEASAAPVPPAPDLKALIDAEQGAEPMSGYLPGQSDAALGIDFHGVGYVVEMKLIDGEYYPLRTSMTWIS